MKINENAQQQTPIKELIAFDQIPYVYMQPRCNRYNSEWLLKWKQNGIKLVLIMWYMPFTSVISLTDVNMAHQASPNMIAGSENIIGTLLNFYTKVAATIATGYYTILLNKLSTHLKFWNVFHLGMWVHIVKEPLKYWLCFLSFSRVVRLQ